MSSTLTDMGHWLSNGILRVCKLALRPFPYNTRLAIGGALGRALVSGLPMARKRALTNIERIYPELDHGEKRRFLRGVGDNTGRVLVEEMMMERFAAEPGRVRASGPGVEVLRSCAEAGRGAIIASAHYGNWEGMRIWSRHILGKPMAGVYRPHNNPYYNADFVAGLEKLSPDAFPKGRKGTRDLVRHLKRGGFAAILVDQKQTGAPLIPFLGHPAETTLTAAKLALSQDIPLIPVITYRAEDGVSFDCVLGAPIPAGDELEMMTAVNAQLSEWIAAKPEQWFWLHRRWR